MGYLGNRPAEAYSAFQKQDFSTSATTSYTLDHPVANQNEIALFINFVRQEPTAAYTASGTTLTLTSATASTDDMYCVYLGKAVQTVNPPSGSVGLSQLSATGTKSSSTFLRGDNTFATAGVDGITSSAGATAINIDSDGHVTKPLQSAVQAYVGTIQSNISTGITTVQLDSEIYDVNSDFNTSNYTFTAPVTGKYLVTMNLVLYDFDTAFQWMYVLGVASNRNYYLNQIDPRMLSQDGIWSFAASSLVDMDANDTFQMKVRTSSHGAAQMDIQSGNASATETTMTMTLLS